MAGSVGCCLNLPPPSTRALSRRPPSSIPSAATVHVKCTRNEDRWKRQFMAGMACVTVGLGMCNLQCVQSQNAAAITERSENPNSELIEILEPVNHARGISNGGGQRWSERRACPPWTVKSFELTVPENLPRPYARKRWQSVDIDPSLTKTVAPSVKFSTRPSRSCFSM